MGEAWFMGLSRETYDYLLDQSVHDLTPAKLRKPLEEIASGTSSFGPREEWRVWFHYLFPRLIPLAAASRSSELQELLVTALVTQYPSGIGKAPYPTFRSDVLQTLGFCIMDSSRWQGRRIRIGEVLCDPPCREGAGWGWYKASGDVSSSLFVCLKYLLPREVPTWLRSVFAIDDPHWRAQLLVWLVGAYALLKRVVQEPSELYEKKPATDWAWSHCLDGNYTGDYEKFVPVPFISEDNLEAFWQAMDGLMSPALYDEWIASIEPYDYVTAEMAGIPEAFQRLYLTSV